MKISLKIAVIALALAATVSTASAAYNTNLTVGSTGADVSSLQTWLISKGFNIPAISSGAASTGYFGSQTREAVVAYQRSINLPSTGFVGPLTRAALNGTSATVVTTGCPAGFICTAIPGSTVTPATPVANTTVNDGRDGSITVSDSSFVSSSQTVKKGDMDKGILSIKARSTVGNVAVSRFDVFFSDRPWLFFGSLTLRDGVTGAVLATKTLSGPSDVTEVTVGSKYLVRFDGINSVVTPNADTVYVVSANVLSSSDKITGQTITVSTETNSLRTMNGLGYTDSVGLAKTSSITLSSTGSVASLFTRVGLTTPDTRTANISSTNVTNDQILGVFDVKVENQAATLNSLSFNINNSLNTATTTAFQNVRLYDGNTMIAGASSLVAGGTTFTNLSIPLSQDSWKSLTLKADVNSTATAFTASSTLVAGSIVGTDTGYNTVTLSNASNRTSNDVTFVPNAGITIGNWSITKGNITESSGGAWLAAYPSISFTITNTGNNSIFISKNSNVALATTTSAGINASTTVSSVSASGSTTGDDSSSYIINGTRTFTYNFTVDNTNGTTASKRINITAVRYGTTSAANNSLNVNYGLESAFVQVP